MLYTLWPRRGCGEEHIFEEKGTFSLKHPYSISKRLYILYIHAPFKRGFPPHIEKLSTFRGALQDTRSVHAPT